MMFLAVIFVITISFGVTAEEEAACASDIKATFQKVSEIHDAMFNGVGAPVQNNESKTLYATCKLQPNPNLGAEKIKLSGQVLFKQLYPHGMMEGTFFIEGFPDDVNQSSRAIHIHDFGDLSNGCDSAGGHYNPHQVNHPNHPGDFGNCPVRDNKIQQHFKKLKASLYGQFSVIGRSIVVHELADDLGKGNNRASLENGNAGPRLACCVIGTTNKNSWEKYMEEKAKVKNSKRVTRRTKAKEN